MFLGVVKVIIKLLTMPTTSESFIINDNEKRFLLIKLGYNDLEATDVHLKYLTICPTIQSIKFIEIGFWISSVRTSVIGFVTVVVSK